MSRSCTHIDPAHAKARLHAPGEIAFLDVREAGEFGEGHPLFAVSCPYSRLELLAPALVPRTTAPVLLLDGGDGIAERAAGRLADLGYADVAVVDGGAPGWRAAGLTLFKGVNVPSKTLGELAEEVWHVPTLGPGELASWQRDGRPHRLFDARPAAEHRKMAIPGAECLPNGELLHRLDAVAADPATPIVVACAGRTRGLVGAAGLRLAGVQNPVFALENGTQGWALAGLPLLHGRESAPFPALDETARRASRARAETLAASRDIAWLDPAAVARLAADSDRTLFLFDVRTGEEFGCGSADGAVHAPGGQLVQATDRWIGVRRARIVLADDTGMRATLAAVWLRSLGFEVYVMPDVDAVDPAWRLPRPDAAAAWADLPLAAISAAEALRQVERGGALLDLRPSMEFRTAHLPGARWSIRPRLPDAAGQRNPVCLVGEAAVAELAARDLREGGHADIRRVEGGPQEWRAAGLPVESTPGEPSDAEAIDFLFFVHDRHDGNLDAARAYLAWETGLIGQLDPAERAEFRFY